MGYGRVGKHRKAGGRGGRGNAGGQHHMRINMDKYHPGYFGKVGMRRFHLTKNAIHRPTVNIDSLWHIVSPQTYDHYKNVNYTQNPDQKVPVIDCTQAGFFKVLGKGRLPSIPVIVKAKYFSSSAEQKIRAAGGICELA